MMQARIRHPQEKRRSPCDALPGGLGRTAPTSETVMAPFVVRCMKAG